MPGLLAYATSRPSSQAGLRPGTETIPGSPVSPLAPGQPLLGTPAPLGQATAGSSGGATGSREAVNPEPGLLVVLLTLWEPPGNPGALRQEIAPKGYEVPLSCLEGDPRMTKDQPG